jgi:hypothetical protein
MNIKCIKCSEVIHPQRIKALPGTKVCVSCSTAGAYRGVTMVYGEGDHTWNDIQLMTPEEYEHYEKSQSKSKSPKTTPEFNNLDDDTNLQGPFIIIDQD